MRLKKKINKKIPFLNCSVCQKFQHFPASGSRQLTDYKRGGNKTLPQNGKTVLIPPAMKGVSFHPAHLLQSSLITRKGNLQK